MKSIIITSIFIFIALINLSGQNEELVQVIPEFLFYSDNSSCKTIIEAWNTNGVQSELENCYQQFNRSCISEKTKIISVKNTCESLGLFEKTTFTRIDEFRWSKTWISNKKVNFEVYRVLGEIERIDTSVQFNPDTYDPMYYIVKYQKIVKE